MAVTRGDVEGLRPGERVRVTFACGVGLTSGLRAAGDRLVLDIPGDNFVVRLPDGRPADDLAAIERVPDAPPSP